MSIHETPEHQGTFSNSWVTDVKLRIVESGTDGLIAWASCVVSQAIKLDNIAIRKGRDGSLFLTYPAKFTRSGKLHYFNPISAKASLAVQDALLGRLAKMARDMATASNERAETP